MIQMKKPLVGDTTNLSPRWGFTILPNITGAHAPAYVLSPLQGSPHRIPEPHPGLDPGSPARNTHVTLCLCA